MPTIANMCFPYTLGQARRVVFGKRTEQLGEGTKIEGHFIPMTPKFGVGGFHVRLDDPAIGRINIAFTRLGQELTRFDNVMAIFATGIGPQIFTDQTSWGFLTANGREYLFKARPTETHWVVSFYTGGKLVAETSVKKDAPCS